MQVVGHSFHDKSGTFRVLKYLGYRRFRFLDDDERCYLIRYRSGAEGEAMLSAIIKAKKL